ncbi:hypothetical protein Dsin_017507 [Dipteronia sinensis]|uniref:Uncharacterized protein n=1 Tax=Dipteronia sinensis TaxID=43782 RepID=A0AAE0AF32_9ROSI|nr:hypothetical protein Dsin_017507 [Dipteronia sinensis]
MSEVREAIDGQRNLEANLFVSDTVRSADILSAGVFDQLGLHRKDLQPLAVLLRGFGGVEVRSLGTVKLPVENALLGIPFLNKTKPVTTTYALIVKFLTKAGVRILKGSQEWARKANLAVYRDKAEPNVIQIDPVEGEAETPTRFDLDQNESSPEDGKS